MKKFLTKTFGSKPVTVCGVLFIVIAPTRFANADPLKEARVSQVIQDVRLLEARGEPRPAVVNDKVTLGSAVRTGTESRAELTFNDLTITRLGANTIFSFTAGARQAELTQGAILLQVKPGAPAVRANTTAVTVAVMGGTALLSTGPPTKFMVLEGTGTIYPLGHPEKAVTVHGGEMVLAEHGRTSKPGKFDVKLVLATSPLITDFAPLANLPLIQTVMTQQVAEQLVVTTTQPLIRDLINIVNVTDQSANSNPTVIVVRTQTPTPTPPPPPPPSKFGPPATITSPNPYVITSGTTITTDPSITTNGVTDYGKIYRGQTDDGPFTLWAFGSTSAFDNALHIDSEFFADPNHPRAPIAAFKFQSLSLNGNPTIDLSNGGVTKLALIAVDGITSGPPGGTLTFTGLDLLVLATVNGSINLTSDVSFQNLNELAMYARGAGSNLILNSPISNVGTLELAAEGSIQLTNPGTMSVGEFESTAGNSLTLQIGGSLLLNGKVNLNTLVLPGTTVANGANLTLNITGNYTNNSATESSHLDVMNEGAHIGTGGNIDVSIGGNLTTTQTGGDFDLLVQNTNGRIDNGGNITLNVNGNVSTKGQLSLVVENYDFSTNPAGHIGTGGNISVTTGAGLTADSISDVINNRNGSTIGSSVNLTLNVGGALTTLHNGTDYFGFPSSLSLYISNRYDNTLGSRIGGNAVLGLHADSASIGGNLTALISNRAGTIVGNALLTLNTLHDFTIQGDADIEILNGAPTSPVGGTINGSATIQLSAANISGNSLFVYLDNRDGGRIDSAATIDFNLTGDVTTPGDATFQIENQRHPGFGGPTGGSIGGDATLSIAAASFSVGGGLDALIDNFNNSAAASGAGGSIGGNATVILNIPGNISVTSDFNAEIANQRAAGTALGPSGGFIGSNATVDITAGALSVGGSLDVEIRNRDNGSGSGTGGSIGGSAAINFNTANAVSSGGAAYFQIVNESDVAGSPGGSIGADATVDVNVGNLTSGPDVNSNALVAQIDNRGGSIGGNAILNFAALGSVNAQGNAYLQILNFNDGTSGPGTIGGNAVLNVSAANITANSLLAQIDNTGGSIGANTEGGAIINMNVSGTATVTNNATVAIYGSDGAVGGAAININGGNYDVTGVGQTLLTYIDGNGTITFNNATAHADVLKAGVFGANGVLNIGGGILSADTELKLYAPGSNGSLNFVSNVTLAGNSVKILAANSITIFNNIVVTINGPAPADVYTTNANYTGFGGNGTTTGTFAGAGAHNPLPLNQAPPFGPPPPSHHNRGGIPQPGQFYTPRQLNVSNTDELLALLDGASVGPDGRITMSAPTTRSNLRNLSRVNMNALPRDARRILMQQMRDRDVARVGGKRIL